MIDSMRNLSAIVRPSRAWFASGFIRIECTREFHLGGPTREHTHMRAVVVSLACLALVGAAGCSGPARSLPPSSLVARAWEGREPPPTAQSWAVVRFAWAR